MTLYKLLRILVLVAILAAPAGAQVEAEGENVNPINLMMSRQHPGDYVAGTQIEVVLSISASAEGVVTAMGLRETVPPGWVFEGMRGITGQPPAVSPEPGATGDLEFAWITPPQFPYSIAYILTIPPGEAGMRTFIGQLEYRLTGGKQVAAPVITQMMGEDTTPPEITLLGNNPVVVVQGQPYIEPGYTATDDVDGDVTARVRVTGAVDTAQTGTYRLQYTATDNAGNQTPPVERVVRVVPPQNEGTDSNTTAGTRYRYGPGYGYTGGNPARQTQAQRERLRAQQQQRNQQTVAENTQLKEELQAENAKPAQRGDAGQPRKDATPEELLAAQWAANAARLPDLAAAKSNGEAPGEGAPAESAETTEGEPGEAPAVTGETEPPAQKPPAASVDEAIAETQRAAEETAAAATGAADAAGQTAEQMAHRAPEAPGFFARLKAGFGQMSAAQIALLVVVLGVAIVILSAAGYAWKAAYNRPRRRRNAAPDSR